MRVLGIDPGTTESGVVVWDSETNEVEEKYIIVNPEVAFMFDGALPAMGIAVIEDMTPYAAGYTTKDTLVWMGRFIESCIRQGQEYSLVTRQAVVKHLCGKKREGDTRTNDTRIRDALIARFPATGGGKEPQVGTKGKPGPLYGMSKHMWAALAVAITWFETEDAG